jgi:carboxymethylenebutenolidase
MGRSVEVTTAIAQFMRDLERVWDQHRDALVEETTVSLTHDRELPWLLPGAEPTFRRAEVLVIAVAGFHRMKLRSVRVLWDYATLMTQLGITAPVATAPAR